MPTNWPPPAGTYPAWPPAEISETQATASNLRVLLDLLIAAGFTQAAPTSAEAAAFFSLARCDHGDRVVGRMLISPDGTRRYPFAVCNDNNHRDLLVLWPPYYCGWRSALE